eukprot:2318917-Pleurochrysis_carterae.AAC.2
MRLAHVAAASKKVLRPSWAGGESRAVQRTHERGRARRACCVSHLLFCRFTGRRHQHSAAAGA